MENKMRGLTIYGGGLYEFDVTDEYITLNKDRAKFIIPDMELDSNKDSYPRNRKFFERVKECIGKHKEIPIYFLGDILNNPTGYADDGTDICGEFLNWFSTLKNDNTCVIRGNGEMDLHKDEILNSTLTETGKEDTYVLTFGKDPYKHEIYIKKSPNETKEKMEERIHSALEKIYNNRTLYVHLIDEKIILTHAPLLDYIDNYFDVTADGYIIKQSSGKTKTHLTSINRREHVYFKARNLFHDGTKIKYNIAGHVPIYNDWNIIKCDNKFCILTNDETYYEKINGMRCKAPAGHIFDGSGKIFVLFNNVEPPPTTKKLIETTPYLTGKPQFNDYFKNSKKSNKSYRRYGGDSSEIMLYEYNEDTFAKLLLFLFFALVIILIVSLITVYIYHKNNTSIKQT